MTSYDRSHKDHHYWDHVKWDADYLTREERAAVKAKSQQIAQPEPVRPAEKPHYKSWQVIESDGSISYFDVQVSSKPVIIDGYMVLEATGAETPPHPTKGSIPQ
jgi:hypothetical protein